MKHNLTAAMDVCKMLEPVKQAEVPNPHSALCTPACNNLQRNFKIMIDQISKLMRTMKRRMKMLAAVGLLKGKKPYTQARREWTDLGEWDRNEKLNSRIYAEILHLATEHMNKS
jgi:hypothetical protein